MTPRPFQPARNGSLKLLREVVQSAILRRKGSDRPQNTDSENEQDGRLLADDNEEILVGKLRELEVENKLEDYEDKGEEGCAEDEYGTDEYEEDEDGDEADAEANNKEDEELREELEEWGENHNRLGEEHGEPKEDNLVEAVDRLGRMERPFNVWQW